MNILKKAFQFVTILLVSFSLSSCTASSFFGSSAPESSYVYDLEMPQANPVPGVYLDIKQFTGNSRSKMAKRSGNRIEFDERGRWVQPPEALLTRYLSLSFAGQDEIMPSALKDNSYILSGNLIGCVFDRDAKLVRMQIQYSLMKRSSLQSSLTVTKEYTSDMRTDSADAYAKALTKCAADFTHDIRKQLALENISGK